MTKRAGVRVRATQRIKVIPHVLQLNINWPALIRAVADGPGGRLVRDAVSWTYGWLRHASVNTRTGRGSINTPGLGSVSMPVHASQAERRRKRASRADSR